ncbi:MAG: fluoride efflux transporter CrcB [Solirubrobacterales bacterium]
MIVAVAVGLLGGLGSVARFAVHRGITREDASAFPLGTFIVNVLGAFAIGVLFGADVNRDFALVAGVGFLGGFTTFSTWMFESERLAVDGYAAAAVRNIAISTVAGFAAVAIGVLVGRAF